MNFMSWMVNFFKDGGIFLYPLALIFVVGVSIAIERYVYLTRETMRNRSLWEDLVPALSAGNFKQVVGLTQNSKASIATILNYGVARVASARRRESQLARGRHLGRNEQHRFGLVRRHHAAARAHVSGIEDYFDDRQPG